MFGLPPVDLVVIVLYFAGMIAIGVWSSRRIKNQEDFFLAGRGFGKLVQTFAAFGQGTSADNAVGVTTTTYVNGASGIWSSLLYLFATPVYWLICPWLRRLRVLTMGDFFLERYGSQKMAATYAVIGSIGMMAFIALGFNAMTKTIVAITPKQATQFTEADKSSYRQALSSYVELHGSQAARSDRLTYEELLEREHLQAKPPKALSTSETLWLAALDSKAPATIISYLDDNVLIWIVCLVVLIYATAGGLEAAFLTDMIQGMFIILLSVILIPFAWAKINVIHGGSGMADALSTIHARLPESFFDIFGSPQSIDFTWYYILALSAMALLTVVIQPNVLVATGSARDEFAARYGFTVGSFLKRFCTVFWGVFGLAAIVLYSHKVHNSDLVWGYATRDLLGPLHLGLVGLMIAALVAALMSTADCLMLTCSSLLTRNLYQPMVPNRSPRHYVWAGRVFGAAVLVGSVLVAIQFDTILQLLKYIWEFNVMLAPAFWLGMKWRRANCTGAWASILIAGLLFLVLPVIVPLAAPHLRTRPDLLKRTDPEPLVVTYTAREVDVETRQAEITAWDRLNAQGKAQGTRPEPLVVGEQFREEYILPRKSVFWTQGIQPDGKGNLIGCGRLSLELVVLEQLGCKLANNSYALNETIRILIRTILPFLIMFAFTLCSHPDEPSRVGRFYAKMRTKVVRNREADARELALSFEDVHRHKGRLLLPNSQWEFYWWNREDVVGFALAVLTVGGVLAMMKLLVSLGT